MFHRVRNLDAALIQRYREFFNYDPETGALTWRLKRGRSQAGQIAGSVSPSGYFVVRVRKLGQSLPVHRLAWALTHDVWPALFIDHINGDRADNRLCNLREADQFVNSQNLRRAHRTNPTGLLGAHFHKQTGKFTSSISVDRRSKHIGLFDSAEQAHAAYVSAKRVLHAGCTL